MLIPLLLTEDVKPGKYKVAVIFESGKLRSAAAAIEIEVK